MRRLFDIIFSLLGLLLVSPLFLFICLLQWFSHSGPIFFCQKRAGFHGKLFTLYKFRTMNNKKDNKCKLLPDDQRLTRLGNFLRKTSFDELPQLWNVLKGELSLVGPRPLLPEYLLLYSSEQARRHDVKPGITGLAQVKGRNQLSWEEKFKWDVWYVDHHTIWLDLKILWLTAYSVLLRRGISASECATMPPFQGNNTANKKEKEDETMASV